MNKCDSGSVSAPFAASREVLGITRRHEVLDYISMKKYFNSRVSTFSFYAELLLSFGVVSNDAFLMSLYELN
jgi:hypothetical protein